MSTARSSSPKAPSKTAAKAPKKRVRKTTVAHDEKRLEIIERCADLFDRVGFHGTSMQMLADEMGLGKPTLYHYFPSKTSILYEMHQLHIASMIEGLESEADLQNLDAAKLLEESCVTTLTQIAEHPGYVRAFMDHYTELEGKQRTEIKKRRADYLARLNQIISAGIDKGQFNKVDPELATLAFLGMCNWAYKWYPRMANDHPPKKMAQMLCQIFLGGLNKA
ncbi:MAG TPA: TetR/AcrR family transcriptional regulator [Burkholderiaceae bacterium]|jgi:AcrR family transcriptional regulator